MKKKIYTIIDIETTGGRANQNKITEIAIVKHDGEKIIDTFESLINPEVSIPFYITRLTGITNEMVKDAPKFYEIAKKIVEITEGCIFVAHNVRFDYGFIKAEFARLGYAFTRKQLCTVRLSRSAFPGLKSYALGKLIKHFKIKVKDRHRAMADTMATVEIFEKILAQESNKETLNDMVNLGVKESLLPKNITLDKLHALPESCGVYFFHDTESKVVYVGKSINIKKRVMEHFAKVTPKAEKLQKYVDDISYEITGSELIALLYESQLIKDLHPPINRAQRQMHFPYMVHTFLDNNGYRCFDICKNTAPKRKKFDMISQYPSINKAKSAIKRVMANHELCPYYCNIENQSKPCFNYHLKQCAGACIEKESSEAYNLRANLAMEDLKTVFDTNFFILDEGRNQEEYAVIMVENGAYRGFGYVDKADLNGNVEFLRDAIKHYPSYPESSRIIQRFLHEKSGTKIIPFASVDSDMNF